MKPTILFTQKNSTYNRLGVECYDAERNALSYPGKGPVICHPPCRLFSRMRKFSTAPGCERLLGMYSVALVRKFGGIVEQPAGSKLWELCKISRSTNPDQYGGFIININQSWFGYQCRKSTDLYIVGCQVKDLPAVPMNFDAIQFCISSSRSLPELKNKESRSFTTEKFARWLIEIAEKCEQPGQLLTQPKKTGSAGHLILCSHCKNPLDQFDIDRNKCSICGQKINKDDE